MDRKNSADLTTKGVYPDTPDLRYVLVTPVRNEAAFFGRTVNAVAKQTVLPLAWVIVDDGSSDGTTDIARKAAEAYPWITALYRSDRGFREVGKGSAEAFNHGLQTLQHADYDLICNLDGDMVIGPRYYEGMMQAFAGEPKLGMAVGPIYERHNNVPTELRGQEEMVAGGAKCWRRACFEDIGGLVEHASWDSIDCYRAMMRGWLTLTLTGEELNIEHLRPLFTSYDSACRGWAQRGRGMWFFGADPIWTCLSGIFHAKSRPFVLAGGAMLAGYIGAWSKGAPQIDDPQLRQFVRRWQRGKIKRAIAGLFLRKPTVRA